MAERVALYDLTLDQLTEMLTGWGEPRFRAEQVWRWLYRSLVRDWNAMANIPKRLRAQFATWVIRPVLVGGHDTSLDWPRWRP